VDHDDALAVLDVGDLGRGDDEVGAAEVETVVDGYMQCARALAELALRPRLRGLMVDEARAGDCLFFWGGGRQPCPWW
jgi:hypothetical protein